MQGAAGPLTPFEAQAYCRELRRFKIDQVGSEPWMRQLQNLEKLNIQAHFNAQQAQHDEFVVEAVVGADDCVDVLVHELIVAEAFRTRVFPRLVDEVGVMSSLKVYSVLFHEATLVNLLEVLMYHSSAIEAAGDVLMEVTDYCYRRLTELNSGRFDDQKQVAAKKGDASDPAAAAIAAANEPTESSAETLKKQAQKLGFSVAVTAVSILRLVTQEIGRLPLSVTMRLVDEQDVLLSLIPLVESPPWTRGTRAGRDLEKFQRQEWVPVASEDRFRLTITEIQVWLAIYNIVMDKSIRTRYEYHSHRKAALGHLRKYFNDILLDQLPMLGDLHRWVEELRLMETPAPSSHTSKMMGGRGASSSGGIVVIEQLPEISTELFEETDFDAVAKKLLDTAFSDTDQAARRRDMQRMAAAYDIDNFEDVLDAPRCARPKCGKEATQRCSRCKSEWYCSRKCQVKSWKKHKQVCDILATQVARDKASEGGDGAQPTKPEPSVSSARKVLIEEID